MGKEGMGKKLNRLFGLRVWKASKLKPTLNLAVSRLLVLNNHRKVRCSQSRRDVAQILQQGQQERALIRVEQVIKDQNMVDAYVIMESYLNLLIERLPLIEHQKECPEELKEAIATLIFASSRCGDFPELQEIRTTFYSYYGKEFVTRCIELRNQCGVNTTMIQKMSTLGPSLEAKTKVLVQIAAENNIVVHPNEHFGVVEEGGAGGPSNFGIREGEDDSIKSSSRTIDKTEFTNSFQTRHQYKDVADAAQDAFENAAYAAAAARAAVELSQTGRSHQPDNLIRYSPKRPEGERRNRNTLDEVVVSSSSPSMKQMRSRLDADQDNVPRLNLDRRLISLRAKRVSGY